jgi:uncharacterized membrane protein
MNTIRIVIGTDFILICAQFRPPIPALSETTDRTQAVPTSQRIALRFIRIGCKMLTIEFQTNLEEPMSQAPVSSDATSDDKLWALLAYIFTPLIPIIIMVMEDKKNRPFIRAHNAQALVVGLVNLVIGILLGWTVVLACVPALIWFACIYWGIQAYGGKFVEIPLVSNFVKGQGWA